MLLKNKSAVVLGASAEGGSGWAIAERLSREGALVVAAARNEEGLQRLAQKTGCRYMTCDAGNPRQVADLTEFATRLHGPIDIGVNAAGLPVLGGIADIDAADVQRALDVNYLGNFHFVREVAARMRDGGSITLISSYSAVQPILPHFAYACAKAATDCLVRYAALEYGARGIRINSLLPGPIKSALASQLFAIPGVEEIYAREIPLGRVGTPEDYADAVVWLSGPAFITGVNLPLSGGNQLTRMPRPDELPIGQDTYGKDFT